MKTKVRCTNFISRSWGMTTGFLMLLLMLFTPKAEASHLSGGAITITHVSGNTYTMEARIYRDCRGVNLSTTAFLRSTSSCGGNFSLPRIAVNDITPTCPGQVSYCQSRGGLPYGYEEHVYRANRTINPQIGNGTCTYTWNSCCRNGAITTLSSSSSNSFEIRTQFNPNLTPRNSTPVFLNPPVAIICAGQPATISPNASDPDGDALVYSLTACLQTGGGSVTYGPGFSATNPLSTTSGFNLNTSTGLLSFTPSGVQVGVVCTKVEEFRAGTKIGEINRDIQINVISCNNNNPVIATIPNQIAQVGQQLCVNVSATDADNDNITLTATSAVGSFTVTGSSAGSATGTFCFTPTLSQQGQTFTVSINAQDDACPSPGTGVEAFNITVPAVQCSLTVNATAVDASCNQSDGSASATQSGGVNPISYNWSNGGSGSSISGLAPGTYTVTVVDGFNCVETASVTVGGGSTNIAATTSTTNPQCPNSADGSITVNTTGGVAPISFSLNGGPAQSSHTFSGLGVGTYTITVTDNSGCPGISVTATLNAVDNTNPVISCPANANVSCTASTAPSATGMATASDNCSTPSVSYNDQTVVSMTCPANRTIFRAWTAVDAFGNSSSCTQTITVSDNTAPVVTCPANITRDNATGQCGNTATFSASARDNCSGATLSYSNASGSFFPVGATTVVVTATDACGNASSCNFTVTINDTENPTIVCPSNITVSNDAGVCGAVVNYPAPATADNCQTAPSSSLSAGDLGFTSFFADNPDEFSFVLLTDVAAGTAISFTDNGWFAAGGFRNTEGVVTWVASTDLVAGTEVVISGTSASVGSASGSSLLLSSSGDQIIAFQGSVNSPSVIAAIHFNGFGWDSDATSSTTSAMPAGLMNGASAMWLAETDNGVYDCSSTSGNVGGALFNFQNWNTSNSRTGVSYSPCGFNLNSPAALPVLVSGLGSGSTFPVGSTVETYTVTDGSGNSASCSFSVTVEDNEAPVITCPADITVSNDAGICGAAVTYNVTASDNCAGTSSPTATLGIGGIAFTGYTGDNPDGWSFVILRDILSGTQISFTDNGWLAAGGFRATEGVATWEASSNMTAGSEVVIENLVASSGSIVSTFNGGPNLSSSGDQIIAFQGTVNSPSVIAAIQMNGAWDADATSSNTSALPAGLTNGQNAIAISPEVDNATYNCSLTSGGPSAIRAAVNNSANWTVNNARIPLGTCGFTLPNGSLTPGQSAGLASGATFPVGTTTNTYSVTDAAGNTSTCSFDVTVNDTEAPTITCPADLTLECLRDIPALDPQTATASDNCGVDAVTGVEASNGGSGCAGDPLILSRTYTAVDIYGNSSSCVQTITVESTPIVTQTSPNAYVFPAYQDSSCATISVAAMGGCPGYTYQWSNGSTAATQQVCPTQTTVYTVTVTDAEGCSSTDSVKVCAIDVACTSRTNNGLGGSGQAGNSGQLRITICHIPPGNPANAMTKCLPPSGAYNHIQAGHGGDYLGACGAVRTCDFGSSNKTAGSGNGAEPAMEASMEAFPNPFNTTTKVVIRLSQTTSANVVVYDMRGVEVAQLYNGNIEGGQEVSVDFNANGLSTGMYFVRLITAEGLVLNKKVNLQK